MTTHIWRVREFIRELPDTAAIKQKLSTLNRQRLIVLRQGADDLIAEINAALTALPTDQYRYNVSAYVRKYSEQGVFKEQQFAITTVAGERLDKEQVKELWHATYGLGSIHDLELHAFIDITGDFR